MFSFLEASVHSPHQHSDRVSVRLVASKSQITSNSTTSMANGKIKLNKKRTPEDDDYTRQETGKKRKKYVQIPNNVPVHLTSNGGVPVDPSFFTNPLSHIQYRAPGQYNFQVPFDPTHPGTSYPPPLPPYNYYALNSNMVPRSQLVADIQTARCMSSRYKQDPFPRCVSCTRRWAGDTCRFQGIRYITV